MKKQSQIGNNRETQCKPSAKARASLKANQALRLDRASSEAVINHLEERREGVAVRQATKKEEEINSMSATQILTELKDRGLPTFGTNVEKRDRLKSHYRIPNQKAGKGKGTTRGNIQKIENDRERRRKQIAQQRHNKARQEEENKKNGIKVDVDYQMMVQRAKNRVYPRSAHDTKTSQKLNICVRKRPVFPKELQEGEIDCISCTNPAIIVHECKFKVDGITKTVENHGFEMDHTFAEDETTLSLYECSIQAEIDFLFNGGILTCFAYGQTGSGKTFTMKGVQEQAVNDLFKGADIMREDGGTTFKFMMSYFEIYGGKLYDLLNEHQ